MTAELEATIHKWMAIAWFAAAVPICVFLSTSVPFLVFVSVYAVVVGHWGSWQAARAEINSPPAP